jgi:uncharacterized RmlC-like cupin family protein
MSAIRQERLVRLFDAAVALNGERRTEVVPSARVTTRHLGVSLIYTPVGGGSAQSHHHGAAETAVYVLEGRAGFYCGGGLRDRVEADPGTFVFIAPYAVHQEFNPAPLPHTMVVARDLHGTSWYEAEAPDTTPGTGTGVAASERAIDRASCGAQRVLLTTRSLAAGAREVVAAEGRETAILVLQGEAQLAADGDQALVGRAGDWFYVLPDAACTVTNRGTAPAALLVIQGPPVDAPALA